MHTVELLDEAMRLATRSGYRLRQEWLGGDGGGGCEFGGRRWIFVDLALGPADQLQQIVEALRQDPYVAILPMPEALKELIAVHKIA